MIKVSVIIPVYNVEKYLEECLDSIINQTLKEIEIICIDDGSTDSSLNVLENYKKKDKRIIVLQQQNLGAGAARNKGLDLARGKYLSFLDADDFFELTMLEKAYNKCEMDNAEICVFRSMEFDNKSKKSQLIPWTIRKRFLPSNIPFSSKKAAKYIFQVFNGWAWDKLYNRKFIQFNKLEFQEIRTTNDAYFVFMANVLADKITILNDILAYHRVNTKTSLSVTREKSWDCCYKAIVAIKRNLIKQDLYNVFKQSYINWALHFCIWNACTLKGNSKKYLLNALSEKYFEELGFKNYLSDFYYDKNEYAIYQEILKDGQNAKLSRNSFSKIYKYYLDFGFILTLNHLINKLYVRRK